MEYFLSLILGIVQEQHVGICRLFFINNFQVERKQMARDSVVNVYLVLMLSCVI